MVADYTTHKKKTVDMTLRLRCCNPCNRTTKKLHKGYDSDYGPCLIHKLCQITYLLLLY